MQLGVYAVEEWTVLDNGSFQSAEVAVYVSFPWGDQPFANREVAGSAIRAYLEKARAEKHFERLADEIEQDLERQIEEWELDLVQEWEDAGWVPEDDESDEDEEDDAAPGPKTPRN